MTHDPDSSQAEVGHAERRGGGARSDGLERGHAVAAQSLGVGQRALGGRVTTHPEGKVEVGYVDIEPTEAGRAWFKGPMKVYQWHREGMDIPGCCELLATNDTYPVQAFRCGPNAFGFQFHPEVTLEMKELWTLNSERLKQPGIQQRGVHLSMHALYDPPLDRWIDGFLDRWLATDQRVAAPEFALAAD